MLLGARVSESTEHVVSGHGLGSHSMCFLSISGKESVVSLVELTLSSKAHGSFRVVSHSGTGVVESARVELISVSDNGASGAGFRI